MGLLTGLLAAPLAPLRLVLFVSEHLAEHAAMDAHHPASVQERLLEVESALATGELSREEAARMEEELLARLFEEPSIGLDAK